jgi:hypothetical protein
LIIPLVNVVLAAARTRRIALFLAAGVLALVLPRTAVGEEEVAET